jgi:hypothetical protein
MIKNLLILKNELVSLEIVPSSHPTTAAAGGGGGMQHFSQIWESTLSLSSSGQAVMGFLAGLGSYIPHPFSSSSPSRTPTPGANATVAGKNGTGEERVKDPSEQLDDLLRQAIYGFTARWGALLHDARVRKAGAKSKEKVERELEEVLERAFAGQNEVVGKLREAVMGVAEGLGREGKDRRGR